MARRLRKTRTITTYTRAMESRVGDATLKQLSAGLQAGGKAYSEIVFFEDKRALDEFESGKFEFTAGASAIAITAAAGASVGTNGVQANASGTENGLLQASRRLTGATMGYRGA